MKKIQNYIDGKFLESSHHLTQLNPWNGEKFCEFPCSDEKDVELAINAAKKALPTWKNLGISNRSKYVMAMADLLVEYYGNEGEPTELKQLIHDEVGKPYAEADIEVIESSDFIRFFAEKASEELADEELKLDHELWPKKESIVSYEPHGVVAIIKPWNYPLEMIAWSLAPALLAGNTVVIKPSEKSNAVASYFAKISEKIGLPKGVLNIICGDSHAGKALVNHQSINYVSFTGSQTVGNEVALACSKRSCPHSLELSGNDPAIVLSDADLELAANGIVWGAYCNAGQVCVGIKRLYVVETIYDEFVNLLTSKISLLKLGKDIGPIVDETQVQHITSFIEEAKKERASFLAGGQIKIIDGGKYIEPTLISNLPRYSVFTEKECFGPLLPIWKVADENEAVELANSTAYALGASLWTRSETKAKSISKLLSAGMVWTNDINVAFPQAPWGGLKKSGVGYELSASILKHYAYPKHYNFEFSPDKSRVWWYPY